LLPAHLPSRGRHLLAIIADIDIAYRICFLVVLSGSELCNHRLLLTAAFVCAVPPQRRRKLSFSCRVSGPISTLSTNLKRWPPTNHCTGNAEPLNLYLTQSLPPTLVSQLPSPAQGQITTSRLAHPGVKRRVRSRTCSRRCVPFFQCLPPSTSLERPTGVCIG
jgi:hypothetical protein